MRFALATSLLFAAVAPAAPVPDDLKGDKARLEALWKELASDDELTQVRATLALIDEPGATSFLAAKCPPVKATPAQLKAWLRDLNEDEEKADSAFEKLQHYDPRIGLTLDEQIELVATDGAARRLICLWTDEPPMGLEAAHDFRLRLDDTCTDGRAVRVQFDLGTNGQRDVNEYAVSPRVVSVIASVAWRRVEAAAEVLHLIDTTASRAALKRLAAGHPDASPTRTATELLGEKSANTARRNEHVAWELLLSARRDHQLLALLTLTRTSDAAKNLKGKLPAIVATWEGTAARLKAVATGDERVWKKALDQLLYFHPLLVMSAAEMAEQVTTDRGRSALIALCGWNSQFLDPLPVYANSKLKVDGSSMLLEYADHHGPTARGSYLNELRLYNPPHWQRARLAVIALERMGSADAKEVLKQLADGHPDILPTKEAEAALKRMKEPK